MSPEERKRMQRDVQDAFRRLNEGNQEKLLRLAQHLAQHKLVSHLYLGADNDGPCCLCTQLN